MKITSGEFKYRKLEVPEDIRPTTEKVREAVFSMIRDWIPDAIAVDLFAGSGALGLEALSRGAAKCYFNESDRRHFRILKNNVANCKAENRAVLSNRDFRTFLTTLNEKPDIIIMDPPYNAGYYDAAFDLINEYDLLDEGSIVVAEHLYDNQLSETYGNLHRIKEKKYGSIGVDIYVADE